MKLSVHRVWPVACCLLLSVDDVTGQGRAPVRFEGVTPNLVVGDLATSLAFYRDVLGFDVVQTVPEQAPFVFAMMSHDGVMVFLNDRKTAEHDLPALAGRSLGGGATLYFKMQGVDALFARVNGRASIVLPMTDQFYGMREFGVADPDGHVLIFAQESAK